jgi:AraC family transcriptional regulator
MLDSRIGLSVLEAQLEVRTASIQLVDIDLHAPFHNTLHEPQCYRLDLCLTSSRAGARARFMQHWSADRYEPAGRLFLLPPGEVMQLRSDPGALKVLVCRLPVEFLLTLFDDDFRPTHARLEASLNVLNPSIRHLLGRIATQVWTGTSSSKPLDFN